MTSARSEYVDSGDDDPNDDVSRLSCLINFARSGTGDSEDEYSEEEDDAGDTDGSWRCS